MNSKYLLAALALIGVPALSAPPVPPPMPPIVGGWHEVPSSQLQAQVGEAARFGVSRLPKPHGALQKIIGAETQVVAGTNYRMLVQLTGGAKWRLQVWKKLDGTMQLTASKRETH